MKIIAKTVLVTCTAVLTLLILVVGFGYLVHEGRVDQIQVELSKPALPVSVNIRKAFFGPGGVAIFRNDSGQLLEVEARFTSPTNRYENIDLLIPSWGKKEIGPLDGWAFAGGQHIELKNANFRPAEIDVR